MVVRTEPPKLTDRQRKAALGKAMEARQKRARIRERLGDGSLTLPELFEMDGDPVVARMLVRHVIMSMPYYGDLKARKAMREIGIAENRRVKGLGKNQRRALIDLLCPCEGEQGPEERADE